jgi:hypothetical protein
MFCVNVIDLPFASLNGNEKKPAKMIIKTTSPAFLSLHATYTPILPQLGVSNFNRCPVSIYIRC